tara:strand:- start:1590 stop:2867 length:1278 start_codon:yes stop_codon:yes gene_type:complete
MKLNFKTINICIIGIGYVGLPLALAFGKKFKTLAFDTNIERIKNLSNNIDSNNEFKKNEIKSSKYLKFTYNEKDIIDCNFYIVTLPTPINANKTPNLKYIKNSCLLISKYLSKNNFVVFESTFYPGLTEEYCIPLLIKNSSLKLNSDFFCGYSPERINPGDKINTLQNVIKITSGSNSYSAKIIDNLYKKIIKKGTYLAPSIKIAEAAKVIENAQRDINIAYMNELTQIFNKLNINTHEVLKAASTKWNFLNFKPGLVGGHCIGVDPYYLTYRSKKAGHNSKIIIAGRKINDNFSKFIVKKSLLKIKEIFHRKKINILVMGLTFKENCNDFRNSKSIDIVKYLNKTNHFIFSYDPYLNKNNKIEYFSKNIIIKPKKNFYDFIILSVAHNHFRKMGYNKINKLLKRKGVILDIKNILPNKKNILKI